MARTAAGGPRVAIPESFPMMKAADVKVFRLALESLRARLREDALLRRAA